MKTKEEMIQIAESYLQEMTDKDGIETIILHEHTIVKPYGSIFRYNGKLYLETGEFQYAIAGNAPFVVEKKTGRVIVFGTARSIDYYIEGYENGTWVPSDNGIWEPTQ